MAPEHAGYEPYEELLTQKAGRARESPTPAVPFSSIFALAGALTVGATLGGVGVLAATRGPSSAGGAGITTATAHFAAPTPVGKAATTTEWYTTMANIALNPTEFPEPDEFSDERYAFLLTKDAATLDVPVGFYVQVLGASKTLPKVKTISAPGNGIGGATHTFFRLAERLHVQQNSIWSTSQACGLRNLVFEGDLGFSLNNQDWGSGGFVTDLNVKGTLDTGIQQQFIVKQSTVGDLAVDSSSWNLLFVGVKGPTPSKYDERYTMFVDKVPRGTQKPFLQRDNTTWTIRVPNAHPDRVGYEDPKINRTIVVNDKNCDFFSADTEGAHVAKMRAAAGLPPIEARPPHSTDKQCVIIGPGIYQVDSPVEFRAKNAVVLALGFATLRCTMTDACVVISGDGATVGGLMVDAAQTDTTLETGPLIKVTGDNVNLFDMFARIYAFGDTVFVRADTMMHIVGKGVTLDNTWLWHADHDEVPSPADAYQHAVALTKGSKRYQHAGPDERKEMLGEITAGGAYKLPYQSDMCISRHALVVDGADFMVYGLLAEHTQWDIVVYNGERGTTFLLQCEVPYYVQGPDTWGASRLAYRVNAKTHTAYGLGGYVTNPSWVGAYTSFAQTNMMYFQATNTLHKVFAWINPPGANSYINVFNTSAGYVLTLASCEMKGGVVDGTACYLPQGEGLPPAPPVMPFPPPPPPAPSPPPSPPAPPPSPPHPPHPPPPKESTCIVTGANCGGTCGASVDQSASELKDGAACAHYCRGSGGANYFQMYSTPGTCFCYKAAARAFPGECYDSPGMLYGTIDVGCSPKSGTCSKAE